MEQRGCLVEVCVPEAALPSALEMTAYMRTTGADMYARMYTHRDLSMAPPRSILRLFGGPLDIAQFRGYTTSVNNHIACDLPPIRLVFPTMNIQGPIRDIKKYVSLSYDTVERASQQLRLKRSKPVNSNIQTLDMCLKAR